MVLLIIIEAVLRFNARLDNIRQQVKQVFEDQEVEEKQLRDLSDNELCELTKLLESNEEIVIVDNREPENQAQTTSLMNLFANTCAQKRRQFVHVIKNLGTNSKSSVRDSIKQPNNTSLWVYDLDTLSITELANAIRKNRNDKSFSSPGASFAWQLATGFLSYILPDLQTQTQSALLDENDLLKQQLLADFGLTHIDPSSILVLPKYFLILDESILLGQQSASSVCPQQLFPGCTKLLSESTSTELYLEFESPGYNKRVPAYLVTLHTPLTKGQSTFSHVLTFCGYAAPLFVMQKLRMSDADKKAVFGQFRDELASIQDHPRSNALLRKFTDTSSEDVTESETSALQVIEVKEGIENCLRSSISAAAEEFVLLDGWSLVSRVSERSDSETVRDELPVMSMAFAMAANTWIGFAQLLNDYIEQLQSSAQQLPFDLPYVFVIPKSGRYPDESKLLRQFEELGARSSLEEFRVPSGRRYSYRVHEWRSRRMAFEIPPCVLSIRKQAECGVGGIRTGDLSFHLDEYRETLEDFVTKEGSDRFRVIGWNDVADIDEISHTDPGREYAHSLLSLLSHEGAT